MPVCWEPQAVVTMQGELALSWRHFRKPVGSWYVIPQLH